MMTTLNLENLTNAMTALSKDGSTKVAATLVSPLGSAISMGYNGLLRGMDDSNMAYQNKVPKPAPTNNLPFTNNSQYRVVKTSYLYKYDMFEHSERNCLYNYVRLNATIRPEECFAMLPTVSSIEDIRALLSIGIKHIVVKNDLYTLLYKSDYIPIFEMLEQINAIIYVIDSDKVEVSNIVQKTVPFINQNKLKQLFDIYTNACNGSENYCAFMHIKDTSLISFGTYGFSDYLRTAITKLEEFYGYYQNANNHKLCRELLLDGTFKGKNVAQSGVKNAIANLLNQKLNPEFKMKTVSIELSQGTEEFDLVLPSEFNMIVSLAPCFHCFIMLLNCGIANPIVTNSSITATTSPQWQEEYKAMQEFKKFIFE